MIYGIGTDIVQIDRIAQVMQRGCWVLKSYSDIMRALYVVLR